MAMAIACFVLLTSGCSDTNVYHEPPPPEVPVALPRVEKVTEYVEQTGMAQASERVELRARVSGFLVERLVDDGDAVKAGQTLFVIDEEPFKVRLQHAKAEESQAEAALAQAQQSKARETGRAQLTLSESELNLAKTVLARTEGLVQRQALPLEELDRAQAANRKAQAQVAADQAKLEQLEADYETTILGAQSALEVAQANVKTAELELGYCRVTSPIDGRIDARRYDVGNYITASDSSTLATVVKVDPIYVNITPSEAELIRIRQGGASAGGNRKIPMLMGIGDERDYPYKGVVEYIAPSVDASTGTVQLRGVFENQDHAIMPGLFVRARMPAEVLENALVVSERSIGFDQAGSFLYVVGADDKVERRKVSLGAQLEGERVVKGDVKATDRIVVDGLLRVRPGLLVAPKAEAAAEDASASVADDGK